MFGVLIGNADAHAKNYSVIYRNGGVRLAPLYDFVNHLQSSRPCQLKELRR